MTAPVQGRVWLEWADGEQQYSAIPSARMTLTRGVRPSVCTMQLTPGVSIPRTVTLCWKCSGTIQRFYDCVVLSPTVNIDQSTQVTVQILDRRWKWADGEISGRYNIRRADNTIDPDTLKTPQELAALLLDAVGETTYDVTDLPNDTQPEVEWDYDNPARQLDDLLDNLGCDIVLGLDNVVRVVLLGSGAALPTGGQSSYGAGLTGEPRPDAVLVVGDTIIWQERFLLEAVGLDVDDTWKPLAELSYYPAGGFTELHGFGNLATEAARIRAKRSVFRSYRLKSFAPGDLQLPAGYTALNDVTEIQLEDGLIDYETIDGVQRRKPAEVRGTFLSEDADYSEVTDTLYTGTFTIDSAKRIVKFTKPVYRQTDGAAYLPAVLYLDCAFVATEPAQEFSGLPKRYAREGDVSNPDSNLVRVYEHDDLKLSIKVPYTDITTRGTYTSNHSEVDGHADTYIDQHLREIEPDESEEATYPGLIFVDCDGAITAVKWQVGPPRAATVITRNADPQLLPTARNRRDRLAQAKAARQAAKAAKRAAREAQKAGAR